MGEPIRVLIVEDHQVLAEGLELALERHEDVHVVGSAPGIVAGLEIARRESPDVVLMDFHLPDGTGAEAAATIRAELPGVAVVILSADSGEDALVAAVESGACGYLLKSQAASHVVDAVRRAASGEMLIPAATLAGLLSRVRERQTRERELQRLTGHITPREREILNLMAQGLDKNTIAEKLFISFTTVRGHVQNILEKLDAHSKLEAVARASEHGLLERSA
jgi:DNA-binding NarL/FixJ family response regulator